MSLKHVVLFLGVAVLFLTEMKLLNSFMQNRNKECVCEKSDCVCEKTSCVCEQNSCPTVVPEPSSEKKQNSCPTVVPESSSEEKQNYTFEAFTWDCEGRDMALTVTKIYMKNLLPRGWTFEIMVCERSVAFYERDPEIKSAIDKGVLKLRILPVFGREKFVLFHNQQRHSPHLFFLISQVFRISKRRRFLEDV